MADTTIKKYNSTNQQWEDVNPQTTHTQIVASGTPNATNYLAGNGTWKAPLYYVEGNTTGTAGTWTGTISNLSAYYDGLTIRYKQGIAGASNVYLNINNIGNAQVYRYGGARLTTHWPVGTIATLTYNSSDNRWYATPDYNSTDDYRMRWQGDVAVGTLMHGYQMIMEGADRKFHPVTEGGSTANTNTVSTVDFLVGGTILYHYSSNNQDVDSTGIGYEVYESGQFSSMEYFNNRDSGWATPRYPFYFKGTINSSGHFNLDNTSYTSWLTQTLPTSDDGFVYIQIGYMADDYDDFRLASEHPIYIYKDGALRLYPYFSEFNGGTVTSNVTISNSSPRLILTDTNNDSDFHIQNHNGVFTVGDTTNQEDRFEIDSDGNVDILSGDLTVSDGAGIFDGNASSRVLYLRGNGNIVQFQGASNQNVWEVVGREANFYIYNNDLSKYSLFIDDGTNNIGINGQGNPTQALDVIGSIKASNNMYAGRYYDLNNTGYYLDPASESIVNYIQAGLSSGDYKTKLQSNSLEFDRDGTSYIQQKGTGNLAFRFGSSYTTRMTLTNDGKLGLGDTNPAEKLTVSGKIRANDNFQHTGTGGYYLLTDTAGFRGAFYDNGTSTLIYGDGDGSNPIITLESGNATFANDVTVTGDLTVNGTTTTLDTTVSTTDQWTVTNAGTDIATIINQTGTADILDVRDNGTSVFKVKDGGDVEISGDIKLTGDPTTTNQGLMIDFTGFDKEGTTDFSDRAYIEHTTNFGGHSGSVLKISSRNDSSDGIAFDTHASSRLKHNGNNIITDTTSTQDLNGDINMGANTIDFNANSGNSTTAQIIGDRSGTDLDTRSFTTEGGFSYTTFNGTTSNKPSGSFNNANGLITMNTHSGAYSWQLAFANNQGKMFARYKNGGGFNSWNEILTSASTIDADTVDGLQASQFIRSDANDTATGDITFTGNIVSNGQIRSNSPSNNIAPINIKSDAEAQAIHIEETGAGNSESWQIGVNGDGDLNFYNSGSATPTIQFYDSNSVFFPENVTMKRLQATSNQDRTKIRLWSGGTYGIGMHSGFTYGGLGATGGEYAITFQMNDDNDRGFWWGHSVHTTAQGAMALTTDGELTVANAIRVGYGEADTTTPSTYALDVSGDANITGTTTIDNVLILERAETSYGAGLRFSEAGVKNWEFKQDGDGGNNDSLILSNASGTSIIAYEQNGNVSFNSGKIQLNANGNLVADGDLYLNNDAGASDAVIYFGDDDSTTAHRLYFDDSAQQFTFTNRVTASAGRLGAIEYNGSDVDKVNFALSGSTLTITTS